MVTSPPQQTPVALKVHITCGQPRIYILIDIYRDVLGDVRGGVRIPLGSQKTNNSKTHCGALFLVAEKRDLQQNAMKIDAYREVFSMKPSFLAAFFFFFFFNYLVPFFHSFSPFFSLSLPTKNRVRATWQALLRTFHPPSHLNFFFITTLLHSALASILDD